jgi:hypothetical protein
MFKNKGVKTTKKPSLVEPKVVNPLVDIVDVDMAITRVSLLKNKCSKQRANQEEICYSLGRGVKTTVIFYQDTTRDASRKPTIKF